jgi:hypothetical protein
MVREKEITTVSAASRLFIRLVLPAGEALAAPPLSAILGQVQVNSNDFCKQFNTFSQLTYEVGVLLNVHLFKNSDGTFFFYVRGIFGPFLIFQAADEDRCIPVEVFYDIFQLGSRTRGANASGYFVAKEAFGALRAINFSLLL